MDLFDLSGKVAIVTGGNSGIGLGIAKGLALAGAAVNIAARDRERTNGAVAEIRRLGGTAEAVIADATDPDSVAAMTAEVTGRHGRLDILVNNVGGIIRKRPEDLTYDEWKWTLNVCIDSAFLCSRAAYPHLKAAGGGKILNNGSMASLFGLAFGAAYGAGKGGMVQLTKSLAVAWAKDNIQVNCYLPGFVETRQTAALPEQVPGIREKVNARCPAGRWGTGDDFAGIAVFLASRASDYITGAAIPVDGGYACAG
jgi:2-dehydro-3-deoxy-D-gluconate 5-dehydrogenase